MSASSEILLAEDNAAFRQGMAVLLESEGYDVREAENGEHALELFRARRPGLVLLDVMMPQKNGYVVCEEIRKTDKETPIVFLTAKDGDSDELRGLMIGADDYISKTSSHQVLLARINAVLTRAHRTCERAFEDFGIAGWKVDVARCMLTAQGRKSVILNLREVQMLQCFSSHPGEVLMRDAMLTRFWGQNFAGNESVLSSAISRLREKLGPGGSHIEPVYGQGYRYVE